MTPLRLGLPKGSLEQSTLALFEQAGWKISPNYRNYYPAVDDPDLSCVLVRAQEMAPYVASGTLDLGLTGLDWILETQAEVEEICALTYSKSSEQPSRWVLVVPKDSPINSVADLQGKKIATELLGFTKRYLAERGIEASVEFSWGATEVKARELVDAIVEVTETGSSLRANKLRIVETLLVSTPRLIANHGAWKDAWKRHKIETLSLLLRGAIEAEAKVGLKMNVREGNLPNLLQSLPALRNPTVSGLSQSGWVAVETIIDEAVVRELIPQLKAAGAEGIIEYPLNKVVY